MKKLLGFVLALSMAFAFMACSQTVSGSDDDGGKSADDFIPGFNPTSSNSSVNSSGANSGKNDGSSASTGSSQSGGGDIWEDDTGDWDDGWDDDSGNSSESSGLDVTKYLPDQKMDCKFSLEDDVWQFQNAEADSTMDMTIKFKDNGDLWFDLTSTGPAESEEACEESAALISVFGLMAAASDETDMIMTASCNGAMFSMKVQGTADEKYTPEQKQEMYADMCK